MSLHLVEEILRYGEILTDTAIPSISFDICNILKIFDNVDNIEEAFFLMNIEMSIIYFCKRYGNSEKYKLYIKKMQRMLLSDITIKEIIIYKQIFEEMFILDANTSSDLITVKLLQ